MVERTPRRWVRVALRVAGLVLVGLCLAYLVKALADLDIAQLGRTLGWREWVGTGVAGLLYGCSLFLLAKAWTTLAVGDVSKLKPGSVLAVYAPGAVAKYLPGSVLQYASRHLVGGRKGLTHGAMAQASLFEAGLHVAIALGLGLALIEGAGIWAVAASVAAAAVLLLSSRRPLWEAIGCQLLFFSAFTMIVIVLATFGEMAENPTRLAGLFFIAWTAGFLVPIAPGGLGVREAALLALAAHYESTDAIVLLGLLTRLVGIFGDGLFGLAGYFALKREMRENTQASA